MHECPQRRVTAEAGQISRTAAYGASPVGSCSNLTAMANRNLDRVLSPEYLDGLDSWPIETIREHRAECQCLEDAASYLRRLLQTRIDILGLETRARAKGEQTDIVSIVEQLPGVLVDERYEHSPNGRLLSVEPRPDQESWAYRRMMESSGGVDIEASPELSDAALAELAEQFIQLERMVSKERRALHDVYDHLQSELIERYRSGRATVDGLLR